MSRLVVVSNRVTLPGVNQAGGLAVALRAALEEEGGLWFGWSGKKLRQPSGELHRPASAVSDTIAASAEIGR